MDKDKVENDKMDKEKVDNDMVDKVEKVRKVDLKLPSRGPI